MQESEDCFGFILTTKSQSFWRVASHGRYEQNRDKLQKKKNKASHLSVYVHLCETQTERGSRSAAASLYRKKRAKERRRNKKGMPASRDAGRADRPWRWPLGPSRAFSWSR